jgi:transposase-like protein
MPETLGNKEIFNGMPHCPRCQSVMVATLSIVLPTISTTMSRLQSYSCDTCGTTNRLLSYYNYKDKTIRDADCKLDKLLNSVMMSFINGGSLSVGTS